MTREQRLEWFKTATEQEIDAYVADGQLRNIVKDVAAAHDAAEDAAIADAMVAMVMPTLERIVAADNAAEEQAAMGTFSSEEESEAEDSISFEQTIIAASEESKRYWRKQTQVKHSPAYAKVARRKQAKAAATDSVKRGTSVVPQYSMFASARQLLKATAKASN